MTFIKVSREIISDKLKNLKKDQKPLWGNMSAHHMVEHLTDAIALSLDDTHTKLELPEKYINKAQSFLLTDQTLPKNFKAKFVIDNATLRNASIEEAVNELTLKLKQFEEHYSNNPGLVKLHPSFGKLNYDQWCLLNSKHLTHHFEQFELI